MVPQNEMQMPGCQRADASHPWSSCLRSSSRTHRLRSCHTNCLLRMCWNTIITHQVKTWTSRSSGQSYWRNSWNILTLALLASRCSPAAASVTRDSEPKKEHIWRGMPCIAAPCWPPKLRVELVCGFSLLPSYPCALPRILDWAVFATIDQHRLPLHCLRSEVPCCAQALRGVRPVSKHPISAHTISPAMAASH